MVFYVNAIRIEYAMDRSIVLDIAICAELDDDVMFWYSRKGRQERSEIRVTAEGMTFWKRILPALIEKARTSW